jgi:hypothetical protein
MICNKCKDDLEDSAFAWRYKAKGIRQRTCKVCHNGMKRAAYRLDPSKDIRRAAARNRRVREEVHTWVMAYLASHPCVDCGEADPVVLDFDHVRGVKEYSVWELVTSRYPLWRVKAEVAKCDVRCANDHRRATARRSGDWRKSRHLQFQYAPVAQLDQSA